LLQNGNHFLKKLDLKALFTFINLKEGIKMNSSQLKKLVILIPVLALFLTACMDDSSKPLKSRPFPETIKIEGIAQNPEGIEYNKKDNTFLLSSLNAEPIIKVNFDGTFKSFTSGEEFPLSTAGLQIDYKRNRLLVAAFNGAELLDKDPATKGTSYLRVYNLETGVIEQDINLSFLAPNANTYLANDLAVDNDGNVYISDWYAHIIYKVDLAGNPSIFWTNETGIPSGPNGLDFHPDGYLLVSLLNVNDKWLYVDYGLVKIPVNNPKSAKIVNISNVGYGGFDGMFINAKGNVVGVTNDGVSPGGNMLIELSGKNNWESARVINSKDITASTTVAITPDNKQYVINQDFSNNLQETWTIKQIKF
jgi:sugar lactone lactonase YvrE